MQYETLKTQLKKEGGEGQKCYNSKLIESQIERKKDKIETIIKL
jgi:hypothetical protein